MHSLLLMLWLFLLNLDRCYSLNSEGLALLKFRERVEKDPYGVLSNWNASDEEPCSWFGVVCLGCKVINLNLQDLCLEGTIAPEIGKLSHIKYLILHNNSFSGVIPKEVGDLKELEVLDVGHNNLSGPLPPEISNVLSLEILLLDNNRFLCSMYPELHDVSSHTEILLDENMLTNSAPETIWKQRSLARNFKQVEDARSRKLLQFGRSSSSSRDRDFRDRDHDDAKGKDILVPPQSSPLPAPAALVTTGTDAPSSVSVLMPPLAASSPTSAKKAAHTLLPKMSIALGASILLTVSLLCFFRFHRKMGQTVVKPWLTGLSGQLQKAFVTGVPILKRLDIEAACEDFSNIIGSSPDNILYKGTLSSGVEIAVTSSSVMSVKDWSKNSETQFRRKIDTLSKVNHKNFVNLLGYCMEEEPFTRMMVFEYAPNGTLFEHLHIREAEHLDWATRLRIVMGMAYCLDHMHQLNPPLLHKSLHSKVVYLCDDYAAKISDFAFWNDETKSKKCSCDTELPTMPSSELKSNVYSFGVILLEMMSGKLPYSENEGSIVDWASDFLSKAQPARHIMDPTLKSFDQEQAKMLLDLIPSCVDADPKKRPSMREVTAQLRDITGITPDAATPRLSPLWWAELEILSSLDAS